MHAFTYHAARSLDDAVQRLRADPQARPLAGGMTVIPSLKHGLLQVSQLVDLAHLPELRVLAIGAEQVHIGALWRHQELADLQLLAQALPGLSSLAGGIGDPQVRARGTLGGSVANNDPAADYPAAVLALDGQLCTDRRELPAAQFFRGLFATALAPDELLVSVRFQRARRSSYAKFRHPASGYAMAGVFLADLGERGLRVAVTGVCDGVLRWHEAEQAWAQGRLPAPLSHPALLHDMHAPAAYRAHLAVQMFEQALTQIQP
ncbi:MAG: xanthine dehydrogenase family protein subunit M [Betaproteobacteria bacterium]